MVVLQSSNRRALVRREPCRDLLPGLCSLLGCACHIWELDLSGSAQGLQAWANVAVKEGGSRAVFLTVV